MARADRGASSWDELDESDVRVRANKKGSRPRTKERPSYDDAADGVVVTVDRGRYSLDRHATYAVAAAIA